MQLIARAPIEGLPDGDKRPGDTFDVPDDDAASLVASGAAEPVEQPAEQARAAKRR